MAMIKITNGEVTNIVSRGAFDNVYKALGFYAVDGDEPVKADVKPVSAPTTNGDITGFDDAEAADDDIADEAQAEEDFDELLEKPLSQWTNNELKSFVTAKGIDTSSAHKTSEVRAIVKKYLDNEAKNAAKA